MKRCRTLAVLLALALLGGTVSLGDDGPDHKVRQHGPIKLGTSGGPPNDFRNFTGAGCTAATLGAAVTCAGVLHTLSNEHQVCIAAPGDEIIHPGLEDLKPQCQRTPGNARVVAHYRGSLLPLGTVDVDAAISTAVPGEVDQSGEILDIGVPCATPVDAKVGMGVAKSGRRTGLTTGTVVAIGVDVFLGGLSTDLCPNLDTELLARGFYIARNAIAVSPGFPTFVNLGDSGSLLVTNDENHNPVGYLLGVNPDVTFWSTAQAVVEAFEPFCGGVGGFRFVGRTCTTAAFSESSVVGPQDSEVEFARMIKERHVGRLMSDPAILGVGVGASDRNPNEAVIVVFLERGRAIDHGTPTELAGVKVKVIFTDPIVALPLARSSTDAASTSVCRTICGFPNCCFDCNNDCRRKRGGVCPAFTCG